MAKIYMSEDEIYTNWKESADQYKQVKIIADLNACPVEDIVEILKKKGVDGRKLPKLKKKSTASTKSKKSEDVAAKSDIQISNVSNYIEALKDKRCSLLEEVKAIEDELQQIQMMCTL